MKYELIGKNDILNPIETIFKNRGIEDINSFMNLTDSVTHDWRLLKNIELAVETLIKHFENDSNIFLQIDSDADGYLSSAILYNYLIKVKPTVKLNWRVHTKKIHGILPETVPKDTQLVIIPDASTNEFDKHKILKEQGKDIIILDHHEGEKYSDYAIVVNNQLDNYPNKEFSACGIVYKFCKALDEYFNVNYADDYLDLVAIGNIADSMSTKELETRYYIQQGLKKIKNPLIKEIIERNSYTLKGKVNIKDVSWTIAPTINAATRIGAVEEKENMFKALTNQEGIIYNTRKKKNESLPVGMARVLSNIRGRQNRLREKGEQNLLQEINKNKLNKNKIVMVNASGLIEPSLSGVIAIKLVEKFKRPVLVLKEDEEDKNVLSGSARGYENGEIQDLKKFLTETGQFLMCQGHAQAHGVKIESDKVEQTIKLINNKLADMEIGVNKHFVDLVFTANQIKKNFINELNKYKNIWGKGVDEPFIYIKDVEVNRGDIDLIGKNKNTFKFEAKGIEYIKFFTNEEEYQNIIEQGERLVLDIVGTCSVNEWEGNKKEQIVIEDYVVKETKKKKYIF